MAAPTRLGVLVSGKGSNLRNLVERGYRVVAVATNRPSCGAAAFARERGLPLGEFSQRRFGSVEERDAAMQVWLQGHGVELVVNAGYDRILTPGFVAAFRDRIINVHPSLLPAFAGGMDAVERALARGVAITGCTVHVVTEEVDAGPILVQAAVPVLPGDTVETLRARIQAEEHRILPEAIELLAQASPSLRQ
ncbi:MAG TPA: phosphoribosylglycinamide formyltransferase [Candidatus Dormibacteraeota bacterium]|nr:phosphoribosylglycinamide formyltransferase [Candidatus Dormibacteraeota bacterium]